MKRIKLIGFMYEESEQIEINRYTTMPNWEEKGYSIVYSSNGSPRYYVRSYKVWIYVVHNGKKKKYDIYGNIMAIYPDRKIMSLELAQSVIAKIITGEIELTFRIEDNPYLIRKDV